MTKLTIICLSCITLLIPALIIAGGNQDRVEKSYELFANGIDKLLIDTEHVYVNPMEKVHGCNLDGVGAIFNGAISMTSTGGLNLNILGIPSGQVVKQLHIELGDLDDDLKDLAQDLTEMAEKLESQDIEKDGEELTEEEMAELKSELKKLNKLSKLSKLADIDFNGHEKHAVIVDSDGTTKTIDLSEGGEFQACDQERVEKMADHLLAFKKELILSMLDFAPILKGLDNNDIVAVLFQVKDKSFREKYGVSTLQVQIPYKKLMRLSDENPDSEKVEKAFDFNI